MDSENYIDIDELLGSYLSGEAKPGQAIDLENWRKQSAGNQAIFDDSCRAFDLNELLLTDALTDAEWEKCRKKIAVSGNGKVGKIVRWSLGVAASILVVMVLNRVFFQSDDAYADGMRYEAYATPLLVKYQGSEINLSPGTVLSIAKGKKERRMELKGNASFAVQHDTIPFIVDIGSFHVRDIGTKFSVTRVPGSDTIEVTVTEGEVIAYDDYGASANVYAGNTIRYIVPSKKIVAYTPVFMDTVIKKATDTAEHFIPRPADDTGRKGNGRPKLKDQPPRPKRLDGTGSRTGGSRTGKPRTG